VLLGIGGRLALVPFGGLLVSVREVKNSGFTSDITAVVGRYPDGSIPSKRSIQTS
jgi:hypothetical protein